MNRPNAFSPALQARQDTPLDSLLSSVALHEFYAATADDDFTALAFALMLAARSSRAGAVVWVMDARSSRGIRPYAPGLAGLGVAPEQLVLVCAPDVRGALRAAADAVACPALSAVVIACPHANPAFDLTASRRLALAAARSGVSVLAVRGGAVVPSAAQTRWAVRRRLSRPLAAGAPGHAAIAVELLRNRAGPAGLSIDMEWNGDARCFRPANPSGNAALVVDRAPAGRTAFAA